MAFTEYTDNAKWYEDAVALEHKSDDHRMAMNMSRCWVENTRTGARLACWEYDTQRGWIHDKEQNNGN